MTPGAHDETSTRYSDPPGRDERFAEKPVIRQPKDGAKVGARTVFAKGWVPNDRIGILAVEPLKSSPTIFIQPFVPDVTGGTVSQLVYLGQPNAGANEQYRIHLLGCKKDHKPSVETTTTLEALRGVCVWSRPVTVYRER